MNKILFYPHFDNPYQNKLVSEIENKSSFTVQYFDNYYKSGNTIVGILFAPIYLLLLRVCGYRIFHLHWQHFKINVRFQLLGAALSSLYALEFIFLLKILRYKVVWTIHNIVPHEQHTLNDMYISKVIIANSDRVIVHSQDTINKLKELNIRTRNVNLIPIGSYNGIYSNTITKIQARNILNIDQSVFTFVFFGQIRKYKGVEYLLAEFTQILKNRKAHLIIAGLCTDQKLKLTINDYKNKYSGNISLKLDHINDDDVQIYLNASDIAIFPFSNITTSSSPLVALAFSKPIIYPNIGNLRDFPENIGIKYNIEDKEGLQNALLQSINNTKLENMGVNGLSYMKYQSWHDVAEKTIKIYSDLLSLK